jgi:mitochondrial fission protein ELM1
MDNLEINLDEEFKNIDISSSNNMDSNMGIDLLMSSSPKKSDNDIKSVKSDDLNSPNGNNQPNPVNNNLFNDPLMNSDPLMNNDPLINNLPEANGGYKPVHVLSQTDIKNEKIDLLYQFKKLNDQGVRTTSNYNMNSNLDDMRNEYIKLKKQRDVENSVKFQRKVMMAAVSGA